MAQAARTTCSFIIVNWNAEQYCIEAVASIEAESGSAGPEIVVVDNNSADGVSALAARFPYITLIRNDENSGFAKGNNLGIAASSGDLLFFVNVDAFLRPGSLAKMIDFMARHPEVGLMGPRVLNPDLSLQKSARRYPTLGRAIGRALALDAVMPGITFHDHAGTDDVEVLTGSFWVVRRSALEEVGPLDDGFFMYGEDVDWSKRFADGGWRVMYFADAEVVHHGGKSSVRSPQRFFVEMRRADLRYFRKHHGLGGMLGYAAITMLHYTIRLAAAAAEGLVPGRKTEAAIKRERSQAVLGWLTKARFGLKLEQVPA